MNNYDVTIYQKDYPRLDWRFIVNQYHHRRNLWDRSPPQIWLDEYGIQTYYELDGSKLTFICPDEQTLILFKLKFL